MCIHLVTKYARYMSLSFHYNFVHAKILHTYGDKMSVCSLASVSTFFFALELPYFAYVKVCAQPLMHISIMCDCEYGIQAAMPAVNEPFKTHRVTTHSNQVKEYATSPLICIHDDLFPSKVFTQKKLCMHQINYSPHFLSYPCLIIDEQQLLLLITISVN